MAEPAEIIAISIIDRIPIIGPNINPIIIPTIIMNMTKPFSPSLTFFLYVYSQSFQLIYGPIHLYSIYLFRLYSLLHGNSYVFLRLSYQDVGQLFLRLQEMLY